MQTRSNAFPTYHFVLQQCILGEKVSLKAYCGQERVKMQVVHNRDAVRPSAWGATHLFHLEGCLFRWQNTLVTSKQSKAHQGCLQQSQGLDGFNPIR
jgi:hypothetical protein